MNKYRDKSDFEINKSVAEELIQSGFIIGVEYHDKHILVMDKYANNYPFDPCNNPADAMPIIIENRIMLNPYCADDLWKCEVKVGADGILNIYAVCYDKNPYRAAMEVFLMMKDAENEK